MNVDDYAFADRRWYAVASDAEISAHFCPGYFSQFKDLSFELADRNIYKKKVKKRV